MAKYILGLELGDSNIKLLAYRKRGEEFVITRAKIIKAPEGTVVDGVICNVEEVYKGIYKEIKKEKYKVKKMVVVIKSSQIIRRNIKMDLMPKKDLEAILALQYQEHLLVDIGQYQVRYKKIEKIWEDHKIDQDLLIVAVPNTIINPLLQVAIKLKMKVESITIASDAISRFFMKEEDVIVVDVGDKATNVTLIAGGYGILNRVIPFGSGSTQPLLIEDLELEIKKLLQFYSSPSQNKGIEKIHMIGNTQVFHEIDKQMTSSLGVSCQLGIELSLDQFKGYEKLEGLRECFANIIGGMSEFCSQNPNTINMVPTQYKQFLRRRWSISAGAAGVTLGLVGLSFLGTIPGRTIAVMEKERVGLEDKLNLGLLVEIKETIKELSEAEDEKNHIKEVLEGINTTSHVSKTTLDIIVSHVPSGLVINSITMDRFLNTVIIGGDARDVASVAQYVISLHNTNQFKEVTYTTGQKTDYNIGIELKDFKDAEDSDVGGEEE